MVKMQRTVSELEVRVRTGSHKQKEEEWRSLDHMMHLPAEAAFSYEHIQQPALLTKFYSGFSFMCRGQKLLQSCSLNLFSGSVWVWRHIKLWTSQL